MTFFFSKPRATAVAARLALAAAAVVASGCNILPEQQRFATYQLPASTLAKSPGGALPLSIRLTAPNAGQLTGGNRILVLRGTTQVSVYEGSRWIDPPPALLRNRLADAFRLDGRFRSVTTDSTNVPADVELGGELDSFQAEYDGDRPAARIRYDAVLTLRGKPEVHTRRFEISEPVKGTQVPEVVDAFGRAADRLSIEVIAWAVERAAAPR